MRLRTSTHQWPLVAADHSVPRERRTASRLIAASAGLFVIGAAMALETRLPFVAIVAIAVAGVVPIVWAVVARRPAAIATGTWIEADATGLARVTPDGKKAIAAWDAPFGVTLLASYGRATALLAFTTPTQTRYVPARIDERDQGDDELLARIAVLADLDLVDGVAHDAALTTAAAAELVRHVASHDAQALGRAYLSDGRGSPIAIDRGTLSVGDRSFDLTSAFAWRPLMFHESTGQAAALYQATWIEQNGSEVFLVAPMPASIVPREANVQRDATGKLGRALTRDLRLLQAPAEPPPPREQRVAIDRPFMMAVRRILGDAPLATRASAATDRERPARRDSIV